MTTLLISGASGLVGKIALWAALDDPRVNRVLSLGRRPLPIQHPKLEQRIVDFAAALPPLEPVDAAICALGTTIRAAGSQAAFRAVDHDAVLSFAAAARQAGAQRFAIITSVGADAASGNFYLSVKGQTERDLAALGIPILAILRPGLILGPRASRRPMERLAQIISPAIDLALQGPLRRYRSIAAKQVGHALLQMALTAEQSAVLEHDAIKRAAASLPAT
jgi:uncharacterized protein YbjT (DUF2867 family)